MLWCTSTGDHIISFLLCERTDKVLRAQLRADRFTVGTAEEHVCSADLSAGDQPGLMLVLMPENNDCHQVFGQCHPEKLRTPFHETI